MSAKGMFWTSVMAKGGVYGLRIRIFGSKGSIEWVQNDPGYLKFNPATGAVKLLERGFHNAYLKAYFLGIHFSLAFSHRASHCLKFEIVIFFLFLLFT